MDALLRYVRVGPSGQVDTTDAEVRVAELTVGSASRATIQLIGGVRPEHAVFRLRGQRLAVSTRGPLIRVNGDPVASADLKVEDVVSIEGHRIRVLPAPSGFDVALEVRPDPEVKPSAFETAFNTRLGQTRLSKRSASWLMLGAVLAVGMALPLAGVLLRHAGGQAPSWGPGDTIWTTGPLIPPHELATHGQCAACHVSLFERVTDRACRKCHDQVHDHVSPAAVRQNATDAAPRCASCHREHYKDTMHFVPRADGLCTDCHREPKNPDGRRPIAKATSFDKGRHPEFKVRLLRPAAAGPALAGDVEWREALVEVGSAQEQSNLTFSHVGHLDPTKVTRLGDNAALGCADCHVLSVDGSHFVPITMRANCLACHSLEFARGRQLPHGQTAEAITILEDFYVRNFSGPPLPEPQRARRVPDRAPAAPTCTGKPYDCGMARARFEIENQFKVRGCASCHTVTDSGEGALADRFRVAPVRLEADYFKTARFDHRVHAVQRKLTGDAACLSCHHADKSERSADVLIPPIAKCLECHAGQTTADRVTLRCVSCHAYHPAPAGLPAREGIP